VGGGGRDIWNEGTSNAVAVYAGDCDPGGGRTVQGAPLHKGGTVLGDGEYLYGTERISIACLLASSSLLHLFLPLSLTLSLFFFLFFSPLLECNDFFPARMGEMVDRELSFWVSFFPTLPPPPASPESVLVAFTQSNLLLSPYLASVSSLAPSRE